MRNKRQPRALTGAERAVGTLLGVACLIGAFWLLQSSKPERPPPQPPGPIHGIGGGGGAPPRHWTWIFAVPLGVMGLSFLSVGFGLIQVDPKHAARPQPARKPDSPDQTKPPTDPRTRPTQRYTCSKCGAAVSGASQISPRGDVVCSHCDAWISLPKDR